jgi:hypothetical protein
MKWPELRRPPPAKPGEVNYGFVDRFTFVHFGIGVLYGYLTLGFGWVALLAVGWEVVEDQLKLRVPRVFPHATADTWKNSLGDVLAVLSGWVLLID